MHVTKFALDTVDACGHNLDPRLQKLIEDVWGSLPQEARNAFLTYWDDPANHWLLKGPLFAQVKVHPKTQPVFGAHDFEGFMYRFAEEPLPNSTDDAVKDLIAHELAHGYYYASGDRKAEQPGLTPVQVNDLREQYANRKMTAWGYTVSPHAPPHHR